MKIITVALASLIASTFFLDIAWAGRKKISYKIPKNVPVKLYPNKNVTSIKPHFRTTANKTKKDNWSTIGNVNPYTGKKGTKRP
ncbi:hypothetical protein APA_724 [Pseudanabaena sp. lw0831]|uniref:hypothetical protein n=1 Tax=Pseudanabaena sp. lw0831 TaxID=1357935 RepID=UPI0019155460|nr:hypothetical protein [Pseudanabaena sp. lw0831]GBO52923.1 hypothetical protein APA_724 [Pseudanabaena sp. lw0831]